EEAKEFAEKLSQVVKGGDAAQVDRLLHLNAFVERLMSDLDLPAGEREGWVRSAQHVLERGGFGQQVVRATADGGSYKLLRVHTVAGRTWALFRQLGADGA